MPLPSPAPPAHGVADDVALTTHDVRRRGSVGRLVEEHPRAADAALAVGVVTLGLVTAVLGLATVEGSTSLGLFRPDEPVAQVVVTAWLTGAALGAALLLARRARPLVVTAALTALAVASLASAGVLGVLGVCLACAVHAVAATRPPRTAWLTCAAVLAVVTVALWWWQDIGLAEILLWSDPVVTPDGDPVRDLAEPPFSPGRRSASVSLLLALLLLGMATGSGARARRLHAEDLAERYRAMARDRDQSAALARAAERTRIAREMHDVVAHSVSVMVALSDGAGAALDRAPDRSREALRELSRTGREALTDMQRVLGALDPGDEEPVAPDGRPEPTATDLAAVVARFRAAGVPVTATGLDVPLPDDTSLRLAVVRVVQEALTNVLRHAPGTPTAEVEVRRGADVVEVEVRDAGGTRPGAGGGTGRGILGMRERAALLGGSVEAGPRPDGGWVVHVALPWPGPRDEPRDPPHDEDEGGLP
ncbi:two-component sensor histidine kinase [Cellulosimicrobium cellulans]|uniref:histidine kinase n=1 Tax=Cellulosimicrobium cellulans TaxID=1710 RepID=A0A1Y0HYN3_CELCE|nr:histidine kinase [Cellulosimicrobium cellulans]ARU53307.1 two-component sensor histidine kinase [Cellulosimicrobium cellulans]